MKSSRDAELAFQYAQSLARAPSVSRYALGNIMTRSMRTAIVRVQSPLLLLTHGRFSTIIGRGNSMAPTYYFEDSFMGNLYGFKKRIPPSEIRRGMYVSFRNPTFDSVNYGKRIIGLPGDVVRTRDDCVHNRYVKVPPGTYWIEGDAGAGGSTDSNQFGPVPETMFTGEICYLVYPFKYWGRVRWWEFQGLEKRIVTDAKELKALEKAGHNLEFVMNSSVTKWIKKNKKERGIDKIEARNREIREKLAAMEAKAVQFLNQANVRCLQVRSAKVKAKAATNERHNNKNNNNNSMPPPAIHGQRNILLEQWRACGAKWAKLTDDVVLLGLPSVISEADRRILEKTADETKKKTGCRFMFKYIG